MRLFSRLLIAFLLLALSNCGRTSSPAIISRTTVGDTLVVVSTPPSEDPASLYWFERDLIIGVAEGDDPYMLVSSGSIAVDEDGRIYTGTQSEGEVRVFGPDGEFLHRFGRRGEGPGEFSANAFFEIHPLQSGEVAVDDIPFQLEVYDARGDFQKSIDLRMLPSIVEKEGYWDASVTWLDRDTLFIPWRRFTMGEPTHHWFLYADEAFTSRTWIDAGETPSSLFIDGESMYSLPYPVLLDFTVTSDGVIIWCTNHDYRLTCYDVASDSWMKIVFELPSVPFTSQDRREHIARELERFPAERRARREQALNKMPFPDHFPQITGLYSDDEGNIWVCRYISEPWSQHPEGYRYDIFNSEGEWQGIVDSPRLFDVIRDGCAYCSGWEEYPTIERYRMVRNRHAVR